LPYGFYPPKRSFALMNKFKLGSAHNIYIYILTGY
jgi:hypothetical protein